MTTDNPADNELYGYKEWEIRRTGELVMWGEGILYLDCPEFKEEDYALGINEENTTWDGFPLNAHVLTTPDGYPRPGPESFRGFAIGELKRKMEPEYTPDITAVPVYRDVS